MYSLKMLEELLQHVPKDSYLSHQLSEDITVAREIEKYIDIKIKEHKEKHGKIKYDSCGTSMFTTKVVHSGLGSTYIVEGLGYKTSFFINDFSNDEPFVEMIETKINEQNAGENDYRYMFRLLEDRKFIVTDVENDLTCIEHIIIPQKWSVLYYFDENNNLVDISHHGVNT